MGAREQATASTAATSDRGPARAPAWSWAVGLVLGVAIVGPSFSGGALLNLDLVIFDHVPTPDLWGVGPAIPRYGPLTATIALVGQALSGPVVFAAVMAISVAIAFAGAARLATGSGVAGQALAGMLYGAGPFMLTRIAVGHTGLVLATAFLPWALPTLLRPGDDLRRTFLWSLAFSATGYYGGTIAGIAVATGLVADRLRRGGVVVATFVFAQLPWLLPGLIVIAAGPQAADATAFATNLHGPGGVLALVLGYGFWQFGNQLAVDGPWVAMLALAVLTLAILGARELPGRWRRRAAALAGVAVLIASAGGIPGLEGVYDAVSQTPLGGPLRESQRFLPLALVILAPAAAHGAKRIGSVAASSALRSAPAAVLALGLLLLVSPWLWGAEGRLDSEDVPVSWYEARDLVDGEGTTLALPWHQYFDLEAADGRRVFNPLPVFLDGDVIASSDPELGSNDRETTDRREDVVRGLLAKLDDGGSIAQGLERLGVRWVVALTDLEGDRLRSLDRDPRLTRRLSTPEIDVWEVDGWRGEAIAKRGTPVALDHPVAPLAMIDSSEPTIWHRPGSPGWLRGLSPASVTDRGLLRVPGGTGPVWFWPALVVLLVDLAVAVFAILALRPVFGAAIRRVFRR